MYLLDDGVEVDAEVQGSTVNNVEKVSERISHAHEVAGFDRRPQFAGFFLDEFASAHSPGDGNGWPGAQRRADVLVKLADQCGG